MRRAAFVVLLSVAVVLATLLVGWPAPAVVGAVAGRDVARGARARDAGWAGIVGWAALLAWSVLRGGPATVVGVVGGLAGVRGASAGLVALVCALLTLGLAGLLAWAAATCVGALLGVTARTRIGPRGMMESDAIARPAAAASPPRGVTLSTTADVDPARDPERAPAAQTP
ncbi:MAG TPA: hypothetical protein VGD56_05560 [Gemmatirosa sp.]